MLLGAGHEKYNINKRGDYDQIYCTYKGNAYAIKQLLTDLSFSCLFIAKTNIQNGNVSCNKIWRQIMQMADSHFPLRLIETNLEEPSNSNLSGWNNFRNYVNIHYVKGSIPKL